MLNVTSNTWFTATLSQPRYLLASTSSTNKIFFGGGNGSSGYSDAVDIFEISFPPPPLPSNPPTLFPLSTPQLLPILSPVSPLPTGSPSSRDNAFTTSSDTNVAIGVGVAAGVLVIGSVVLLLVLLIVRKRRRKQKTVTTEPSTKNETQPTSPQNIPPSQNTPQSTKDQIDQLSKEKSKQTITTHSSSRKKNVGGLDIGQEIGRGSFGKVYLGTWENKKVVVKVAYKNSNVLQDLKVLTSLPPHPNVLQVLHVTMHTKKPAVVMEYCDGVTLDKIIYKNTSGLDEKQTLACVIGIAKGMQHLHAHGVIHRGLAPHNIFLTNDQQIKIADYGLSEKIVFVESTTATAVNLLPWLAPETLKEGIYNQKTDVWSFGMLVYAIVAKQQPFSHLKAVDSAQLIRDTGATPDLPTHCAPLFKEVIEKCWEKKPSARPNFEEICAILEKS